MYFTKNLLEKCFIRQYRPTACCLWDPFHNLIKNKIVSKKYSFVAKLCNKIKKMEEIFEETFGTGWFQYRTTFLNVFVLVTIQVGKEKFRILFYKTTNLLYLIYSLGHLSKSDLLGSGKTSFVLRKQYDS